MMSFNAKKCHIMSITLARKHRHVIDYHLAGETLQTVKDHPYLGVTFSDKMKWNSHIHHICKKANQTLGFLRRNLSHCPKTTKEMAYKTLVRPTTEYCSTVWNPRQSNMIDKIEMVQRRAARFVTHNYGRQESPTEMIKALGWHTLEERRARQSLVMFFKIVTNRIAINKDLLTQEITGRTRRNHDLTYCHQQCQVEAYRQSFFPSTIPKWNALPAYVVSAPSVDAFKARLLKST